MINTGIHRYENSFVNKKVVFYPNLVGFAIATGCIVYIEPPPYDILISILFVVGFLFSLIRLPRKASKPLIFLWIFILGNILSLFFASHFYEGVRHFLITLYLIMNWVFFVSFLNSYKEKGLTILANGYTVAAIISGIGGILSYFKGFGHITRYSDTFRSAFGFKDPNVFGPFLIFIAILSLERAIYCSNRTRYIFLLIFMINSIGVFLSFSRGAWLNFTVSLFMFLLLHLFFIKGKRRRIRILLYLFIIIFMLIIVLNYIFHFQKVSEAFSLRARFQPHDISRFQVQRYSYKDSINYPLGIGPLQTKYIYGAIYGTSTHDLFGGILIENGFVSCMAFILFWIITMHQAYKLKDKHIKSLGYVFLVVFSVILGHTINSFFVGSLHWRHLWLLVAIPWGFDNQNSKGNKTAL